MKPNLIWNNFGAGAERNFTICLQQFFNVMEQNLQIGDFSFAKPDLVNGRSKCKQRNLFSKIINFSYNCIHLQKSK